MNTQATAKKVGGLSSIQSNREREIEKKETARSGVFFFVRMSFLINECTHRENAPLARSPDTPDGGSTNYISSLIPYAAHDFPRPHSFRTLKRLINIQVLPFLQFALGQLDVKVDTSRTQHLVRWTRQRIVPQVDQFQRVRRDHSVIGFDICSSITIRTVLKHNSACSNQTIISVVYAPIIALLVANSCRNCGILNTTAGSIRNELCEMSRRNRRSRPLSSSGSLVS